ncbi:MAG: Rossmann-like and DUF2520 domain-containing protein, partial [Acidimicrobiia bacterium]
VGAGRVGSALGALLQRAGYKIVGFSSRSSVSLAKSQDLLGVDGSADPAEAAAKADCIIISVPDDSVASVCEELCARQALSAESWLMHTSGSLGREALSSARSLGAHTLAVHVLQSVPSALEGIERIPGSWFGVTCDENERDWARVLVADLGGKALFVDDRDRVRYHLAAVFASNFLVTLADLAGTTFESVGPYLPLMKGTLANIAALGTEKALTGPIVRGDAGTVKRHVAAIRGETDLECYRALSEATIDLAVRSGRLSREAADGVRKALY